MYYFFPYEEPVFRPPSEAQSLILQITVGCSQNTCRFCGMYKMKKFRVRSLDLLLKEVESIPESHRLQVQRIFLGDGDGLIYPQRELVAFLDVLSNFFPNLNRIGTYASPNSLASKSVDQLKELRQKKVRILYFGLESGDSETLQRVSKGFRPEEMLQLCRKAQDADLKLSVTAILGLAGQERSSHHAAATADWINELSPEYFSMLTLFRRHNDDFFGLIKPLTNGGTLEEALSVVQSLNPSGTILRTNHISNLLDLAGRYPKDREKIIFQAESCLSQARRHPEWFDRMPEYLESHY